MTEKKGVAYRNALIGVGAVCAVIIVIVIASYGNSIVNYTAMLNDKDRQISSLNSQLSAARSQISQSSADKDAQIANLQSQVNDLSNIANLQKSEVWVNSKVINQDRGAFTQWTPSASYAGFVRVWVESSTTSNTYVEVSWTSHEIQYTKRVTVGSTGTAIFPILPATVTIKVGNTNTLNGATETVTITYWY